MPLAAKTPVHTVHKSAFLLLALGLRRGLGMTKVYMTTVASQQELVGEGFGG